MKEQIQWCIDQHKNTNHFYDTYLPYEFHLRMVVQICDQFVNLIISDDRLFTQNANFIYDVKLACWGHGLIEDTRVSYNDCKSILGVVASDIIYAVSNEKGKNRAERANEKYYDGIRTTPGAVFVKMCDRIANVQYSKMTGSKMFEMYKKENCSFIDRLALPFDFRPMSDYLNFLFDLGIAIEAPNS